jgi:dehydrogenase/reductase SDR family protein 4
MKRFHGKVCLVTASASGIGLSIAKKFGDEGGKVVISSRNEENVEKAKNFLKSFNIECEGCVCHVAKDRKKLVKFVIEKYGKIDVLVNNAGVANYLGATLDTPEGLYEKILEVNVKSAFYMVQEALPYLKETRGVVLFVSSMTAYKTLPSSSVYAMSKTCLLSLTKSLSVELGNFSIRVNSIAPGIIRTKLAGPMADSFHATNNALGRIGTLDDIAGPACFLCSDEAAFITGETLLVTGGTDHRL